MTRQRCLPGAGVDVDIHPGIWVVYILIKLVKKCSFCSIPKFKKKNDIILGVVLLGGNFTTLLVSHKTKRGNY